jgi:serine/threonine protein kinase
MIITIKMQHLQPNTTLRGGKYRIERVLGQGGFGNTYIGYNTEFEETVAIKEFFMKGVTERDETTCAVSVSNADNVRQFEEQREKFKKEAQRIRKLDNPHIVKVHDLFEENGTAYYVMDFVEGENLSQRLKRTGKPIAERKVREIFLQLLDALKAVHDAGMWHLDIKPANIMLDKENNVKLIDFGASKQLNSQKGGATTSTAISYTNGYAPREQMEQNYDKFGPWTDIYALGATLYNLLTKNRPPMPSDIDDDLSDDKHDALPFPASTSEEMRHVVLWMMSTNRLQRPQNVNSVIDFLNKKNSKKENTPLRHRTPQVNETGYSEETIVAPLQSKRDKKGKVKLEHNPDGNFIDEEETIVLSEKGKIIEKHNETPREQKEEPLVYYEEDSLLNKWKYWIITALWIVSAFIGIKYCDNSKETISEVESANNTINEEQSNTDNVPNEQEDEVNSNIIPVDLGLPSGIKWANKNLGASKVSDVGDYYAWGGTKPFESFDEDYTLYNKAGKYNLCGTNNDVAHITLGDNWRLPKYEDFEELVSNCKWTWTTLDGQLGFEITGNNGNSIFLPAGGTKRPSGNDWGIGEEGFYWSGELYRREEGFAKSFQFNEDFQGRYNTERCDYLSIRPVYK